MPSCRPADGGLILPAPLVIVGAAGGIGSAIARHAAAAGHAPLCLLDLRPAELAGIAAETGGHATAVDVRDAVSVDAAFAGIRREHGAIRGLVVASGVVDTGRLAELEPERWNEVLAVNLTGPFLCCRAARDLLVEGGRIVTLGSLAGRSGGVLTGPAYAAAKGGLEALTRSLALELAPRRITVNCVAPGAVETPMLAAHSAERKAAMAAATPLRRMARPEEVAAMVCFLLGADAAFTTGALLAVNGGLRMD